LESNLHALSEKESHSTGVGN